MDVGFLTGLNLWVAVGLAIAAGIVAAINAVGSGLNDTGTRLTFISLASIAFFLVVNGAFDKMGIPDPYLLILTTLDTLMFGAGVFLLISE
jgi:hypothetical protein